MRSQSVTASESIISLKLSQKSILAVGGKFVFDKIHSNGKMSEL